SLTAWYFDASNYNNANWLSIFTALFFTNYYPLVFTFVSLGILSAFGFLFIQAKNKQIPEKNIPWLIAMALWAGLLVFAGSLCGVLTAKYYITSSLAIYLLIGYAISLLKLNRTGFILLIFFLFLILFPSGLTVANRAVFSWKDAVNYIEKNETDTSLTFVIPFNETLPLSRYYHGRRPLLGVYPYQDNLTFEERVVRFNWNKQVSDKKFLEKWLTEHTNEADKLFYIQYTDTYDWTHQILLSQGWKVKNSFRPRGFVNIYVFEFVRADK
ncbi:MAG TPA: hypothetical protein VJB37_02245, partial [Patescibacteria group bacterium]|nr:hypothetical protein [Patescibacteria group bacterium]